MLSWMGWCQTVFGRSCKIVNMGKFTSSCANSEHNAWKSTSNYLINLKGKVGESSVFYKAFTQSNEKKLKDKFCIDCIPTCFKKRQYTSRLPNNYRNLPSFAVVSSVASFLYTDLNIFHISTEIKILLANLSAYSTCKFPSLSH